MRISGKNLFSVAIASSLGLANGASFQNTGALLVSVKPGPAVEAVGDARFDNRVQYLDAVNEDMEALTEKYCLENPEKPISYVKVYGLSNDEYIKDLFYEMNGSIVEYLTPDVVYQKSEDDALRISESCASVEFSTFEFNDETISNIKEISDSSDSELMFIQFPPTFAAPSASILEEITSNVKKIVGNGVKREDMDYDAIEQELQESFEEVEALLDEEIVSIYENEEQIATSQKASSRAVSNGSLFDKYTFFSNGIWMAIIVMSFLVTILLIALSWLSDMKTTYAAFDKPVDFEKKLQ